MARQLGLGETDDRFSTSISASTVDILSLLETSWAEVITL
jgi:hypothetical protein